MRVYVLCVVFFKQKAAYEMRISDWSSDVCSSDLMEALGLSTALGAFVAGVMLADSPYRHALEADVEPFRSTLLGLFFLSIGMILNLTHTAERPLFVVSLALAHTPPTAPPLLWHCLASSLG